MNSKMYEDFTYVSQSFQYLLCESGVGQLSHPLELHMHMHPLNKLKGGSLQHIYLLWGPLSMNVRDANVPSINTFVGPAL